MPLRARLPESRPSSLAMGLLQVNAEHDQLSRRYGDDVLARLDRVGAELHQLRDGLDLEKQTDADKGIAAKLLSKLISKTWPLEHVEHGCHGCMICLGEFVQGDRLMQVPSCHHWFHADCMSQWLQHKKVCPICRFDLKTLVPLNRPRATPEMTHIQLGRMMRRMRELQGQIQALGDVTQHWTEENSVCHETASPKGNGRPTFEMCPPSTDVGTGITRARRLHRSTSVPEFKHLTPQAASVRNRNTNQRSRAQNLDKRSLGTGATSGQSSSSRATGLYAMQRSRQTPLTRGQITSKR